MPAGEAARREASYRARRDANHEARQRYLLKGMEYTLFKRYGLTVAEYVALADSQGGICAICKRAPHGGRRGALHVDHDHKTGHVRGLLCDACNNGIGRFRDDPDLVRAALVYLEAH
jgi:hypothetical protein